MGCTVITSPPHEWRPLANTTISKIHFVIGGALAAAVRWEWIGSLALLIYRLLEDINAPGADRHFGAPDGLEKLTQLEWPTGTVLSRDVLEAARDGTPYPKP